MASAPQKIFRIRREYNTWVADETLEDYALRYTPRTARRWSEWRVANTAFGGISFLALEAIGAAIALNYGFANAGWAILVMGIVIFLTALPISVYAARYGLDMDLLTRGAGFGYLGSTITSLIYATFTFIFFAVEAAIMALALQMAFDWPLIACYLISALIIIPMVLYGITFISRLQAWTQPVWALMLLTPFLWLAIAQPEFLAGLRGMSGISSGSADFDLLYFGAASTVVFALVVQVGEQVDYLRFMPERTSSNRWRWWLCVLMGGPGWVVMGMARMLGGAFLAFVALQFGATVSQATDPTHMYLSAFTRVMGDYDTAIWVTVLFVVLSQVNINVTNAYAGSLAWSNVFARLTRSHPGRVVWLVFNVIISTLLMTLGVLGALEMVLGIYSNVAVAWVGALVADLVINKPLGWSPSGVEFRRAFLYDLNPVGLGAMGAAAAVASVAYAGLLGPWAAAFAPFIALLLAMVVSPLLAWATRGRWYLARPSETPPAAVLTCIVCENRFEHPDMAFCPAYGGAICSLCCSLDSRCSDRCKPAQARAGVQVKLAIERLLPGGLRQRFNFRVAEYLGVFLLLAGSMALALLMVYAQESIQAGSGTLKWAFIKAFSLVALLCAVYAWWVVLVNDSRRMARGESERQTQALQREVDAHQRTDRALQLAKEQADVANQAKTRYVAGMAHELRTPLTSILGYAQLLLRDKQLQPSARDAMATVQQSGQHMHALIDGVLDLARIEAGRLRLEKAPLNFPGFLDALVRMVRPEAHAKGLAFTMELEGRVPLWVRADAKRLRQILINLLSNAIRFTDQGHITLRMTCHSDVVRFEVEDTGIGIAPQDQERIFTPFERGSAGRRQTSSGTGLGLAITQMLTVLMGGELTLRSVSGQGSTFTLRLYLREIALPDDQANRHAQAERPVSGYVGRRQKLLVVDDQPVHRQLLAGRLIPLGFIVREAASGRECLEIVAEQSPDAVLLDLSMDDLSGWETARLLRLRYGAQGLPIIVVSADLFENQPERLHEAACQAFVGKPVLDSELLDALASVLAIQWTAQEDEMPLEWIDAEYSNNIRPLPEDIYQDLFQLARFGNARGVRQLLELARRRHPHLRATLDVLSAHAARFDFNAFLAVLRTAGASEETMPDES